MKRGREGTREGGRERGKAYLKVLIHVLMAGEVMKLGVELPHGATCLKASHGLVLLLG